MPRQMPHPGCPLPRRRPAPPVLRGCGALAALLAALATPADARERVSLLDLLAPEMLVERAVQMGLLSLRSQMDLQYDHLTADIALGQVALSGLRVWPPDIPWDETGGCTVSAARASIASAGLIALDRLRLKLELIGVEVAPECVPAELRPILLGPDSDALKIAWAYADVDYALSSARADVALHLDSPGLAALDATAAFSYVSLDARGGGDPTPVAFLEQATIELENRGVWSRLKPMLPPEMQNTPTAVAMAVGGMSQVLMEGNAAAVARGAAPSGGLLTPEQEDFLESLRLQVERFLTREDRLVLELAPAAGEVNLTEDLLRDPRRAFAELRPLMTAQPFLRSTLVDVALLARALEDPAALSQDERLTVGLALMTGQGAPRATGRGLALLAPLAAAGDAGAAATLARELSASDPALAYRHALAAAAAGAAEMPAMLDRLEADLGMVRVLEIQSEAAAGATAAAESFTSLAAIRAEALARLTGAGALRSYPAAWYWATLGAAASDPAARALRDEVDARMRLHGDEAAAAWDAAIAPLAEQALRDWLRHDMAARLAAP